MKVFKCEICKKEFTFKSQLDKHITMKKGCISTKEIIELLNNMKNNNSNCIQDSNISNSTINSNNSTINVTINVTINSNINPAVNKNVNINNVDTPGFRALDILSNFIKSLN